MALVLLLGNRIKLFQKTVQIQAIALKHRSANKKVNKKILLLKKWNSFLYKSNRTKQYKHGKNNGIVDKRSINKNGTARAGRDIICRGMKGISFEVNLW